MDLSHARVGVLPLQQNGASASIPHPLPKRDAHRPLDGGGSAALAEGLSEARGGCPHARPLIRPDAEPHQKLIPTPDPRAILPPSTGQRWSCNDQLPGDSREASASLTEAGSGDGKFRCKPALANPLPEIPAPRGGFRLVFSTQGRNASRGTVNHPNRMRRAVRRIVMPMAPQPYASVRFSLDQNPAFAQRRC